MIWIIFIWLYLSDLVGVGGSCERDNEQSGSMRREGNSLTIDGVLKDSIPRS